MTRLIPHLAAAALLCGLLPSAARAQQDTAPLPQQRELQRLQQRIEQTREARSRLQREQQALQQEAQRISRDLVRLAARAQALEQRIGAAERRIAALKRQRGRLLARLSANRAAISRLLAVLQRLRRDPPPPFVTRPDDVLAAVRGALAVSALLPRLNERVRTLRGDLEKLARLQERLRVEQAAQRRDLATLQETSGRLQGMLRLKQDLLARTRRQLATRQAQLERLMKQARTLEELLRAVERQRQAARQRQEPARTATPSDTATPPAGQPPASRQPPAAARPRTAAVRPAPAAIPFQRLRGRLPWPAQGRRVAGFGQRSRLLGQLKGLYVATLPGAVVTAPADARVLLAGRFRGYGNLVILNVGQGYRILLAGLKEVSVHAGERVRAGEPVGRMGRRAAPSTVVDENVAATRPILYMELRKGRKLLDPSAWFIGGRQARRN